MAINALGTPVALAIRPLNLLEAQQTEGVRLQNIEQAQEQQRQNALRSFYADQGPQLLSGDTNAPGYKNALDAYARIAGPAAALNWQSASAAKAEQQAKAEQAKREATLFKTNVLLSGVNAVLNAGPDADKQKLYDTVKANIQKNYGYDLSDTPQEWSDDWGRTAVASGMSLKDQIEEANKRVPGGYQRTSPIGAPLAVAPIAGGPQDPAQIEAEANARNANLPPPTRNVIQGGNEQTQEWDRATKTWRPIGQAGPRFSNQVTPTEVGPSSVDLTATDPDSNSILAQTGLSVPGFMVLTGKTSQLPRDRATRAVAFKEAQDFLNKKGVDLSTLQSQYGAYNETLNKNIQRVNQTKIMEDELAGTLDNLRPIANAAGMGSLRIANVAKVFAGQETNDPIVQQYAFQLNQLRSELAAYNGALQGRSGASLTQQDYSEAERVIKNGLSTRAANGLQTAVASATAKMQDVLGRNVDNSRKAIWNLFGVGKNYKSQIPQASPQTNLGGGRGLVQAQPGAGAAPTGIIQYDAQGNRVR